jgi:uncharacterized delta-60 repeat protein
MKKKNYHSHSRTLFRFLIGACLLAEVFSARGQGPGSLDTSFDPGTGPNGTVLSVATQTGSKVVLGGTFTQVNGVPRSNIARLNANGSVDTGFNPGSGTNAFVSSVAVQTDGKVLIGGDFIQVNGVTRGHIARLNTDGSVDTGFDPGTGADAHVRWVAAQADGKVLICGDFIQVNGVTRIYIARLNANGSVDMDFDPGSGPNQVVSSVAPQTDGKVVIGGFFSQVNGVTRNRIARLNANGSVDTGFDPGTGADQAIYPVTLQSDGKVLIGGVFTQVNGVPRNRIARLNANGSVDTGFNPGSGANNTVYGVATQTDGKVIICGNFNQVNGVTRSYMAQLNANGSVDTGFNAGSGPNGSTFAVATQTDGKMLIGGVFTQVNGVTRNRIARLNGAGQTPPPAAKPDFNSDGFTDYLLFNSSLRRSAIWYLQGNVLLSGAYGPTLPAGWVVACVADVNRDSKPDYVLFQASTRRTAVYFLNNATFLSYAYGPTLPAGWTLIAAVDFNNDAKPDYVLFNASTRQSALWYLNGAAYVSGAGGPTLPAGWILTDALDFNANGKPDFVISNASTRRTALWYLNGGAFASSTYGPTLPSGWTLQGAADFNSDAMPDYVLFQASTRRTALWYLNGATLAGSAFGPTLSAGYSLASP